MSTSNRSERHLGGGGDDGRLAHVDRGICSLLRVDLHAMIRLLGDQPLTVADILAASEPAVPHGSKR